MTDLERLLQLSGVESKSNLVESKLPDEFKNKEKEDEVDEACAEEGESLEESGVDELNRMRALAGMEEPEQAPMSPEEMIMQQLPAQQDDEAGCNAQCDGTDDGTDDGMGDEEGMVVIQLVDPINQMSRPQQHGQVGQMPGEIDVMGEDDEEDVDDELETEPEDNPDAMVDIGDEPILDPDEAPEKGVELEPETPTTRNDGSLDTYELINQIQMMQDSGMSASSARYDIERLMDLPIDRVVNVHRKVMGEEAGEGTADVDQYTTNQDEENVVYDEEDLFPSGSATNAIHRVSNTGSKHSDNPMATVDPVVRETVIDIQSKLEEAYTKFSKEYNDKVAKKSRK